MSYAFNRVVLVARQSSPAIQETCQQIKDFLQHLGVQLYLEALSAESQFMDDLPILPQNELANAVDLSIVIGGDGSILHAAKYLAPNHIPVLGINRGRLGFLADVLPEQFSLIADVLNGDYRLEKRFMLKADVTQGSQPQPQSLSALNDIVLQPERAAHMIEFEIYINEKFMCSHRSDGLIIATPTGSTAYALSGGGPILHPNLDVVVLVPMFPHSLAYRPIVVNGDSKIHLILSKSNDVTTHLCGDGEPRFPLTVGDLAVIYKNPHYLELVHPLSYDYYESLRSKLHWSHKH